VVRPLRGHEQGPAYLAARAVVGTADLHGSIHRLRA
jgi:hypothetical protein